MCLYVCVSVCARGGEGNPGSSLCRQPGSASLVQRPHTCLQTLCTKKVQYLNLDNLLCASICLSEQVSAPPASSHTALGCSVQRPFLAV